MRPSYITPAFIEQFISTALAEDMGDGDHSTLAAIPAGATSRARLLVKDDGILAGVALAPDLFRPFDPTLSVQINLTDGASIKKGDIAFMVEGKSRSILTTERLVLNCMQRMSGIATLTSQYVNKLKGYHTRLLDTRKTTPNFRLLEKEAVRIGGGVNHRMGLYDMVMLKDNHIDFAGGITNAVKKTIAYLEDRKLNLQIEVETRNLDDVREVLAVGGIHRIMLDNFRPEQIGAALDLIKGRFETEASGGITLENVEEYAKTGVDFVSVGAVIHHAVSLDLSLKATA